MSHPAPLEVSVTPPLSGPGGPQAATAASSARAEDFDGRGKGLARRVYGPRQLGLGLGGLGVGAALWQHGVTTHWLWLLLFANAFAWPHVAYAIARRAPSPFLAERRSLMIDSVSGGFWISAMAFNLLPSVLVLTMLSFDNIAIGGWRLLLRGLLAHGAGIAIGLLLLGWSFEPSSSLATIIACLPFLITYPLVLGFVTHKLWLKLSAQKAELLRLHERDALSGLFSKTHWQQRLDNEFSRQQRHHRPVSLLLLDIDHFKTVNDRFGHAAGDAAIRHFGHMLLRQLRATDIAGRFGGEEFAIIVPETDATLAAQLAERIRISLANERLPIGDGVRLTISIGIAQLSEHDRSSLQWLERADRALYRAKNGGRNTVRTAPPSG